MTYMYFNLFARVSSKFRLVLSIKHTRIKTILQTCSEKWRKSPRWKTRKTREMPDRMLFMSYGSQSMPNRHGECYAVVFRLRSIQLDNNDRTWTGRP